MLAHTVSRYRISAKGQLLEMMDCTKGSTVKALISRCTVAPPQKHPMDVISASAHKNLHRSAGQKRAFWQNPAFSHFFPNAQSARHASHLHDHGAYILRIAIPFSQVAEAETRDA